MSEVRRKGDSHRCSVLCGGGSAGRKQCSRELAAVEGHSFSSRNPNCGMRLVRAHSEP